MGFCGFSVGISMGLGEGRIANSTSGIKPENAAVLPSKCGVSIPFNISASMSSLRPHSHSLEIRKRKPSRVFGLKISGEMFANLGSTIAGVMFIWAMIKQYCPFELGKYDHKAFTFFYPYVQITFDEFTGERFMRSEAYRAVETFLGCIFSMHAKRLKASDSTKTSHTLTLSMDDFEEVADEFQGVKLWWASGKHCRNECNVYFLLLCLLSENLFVMFENAGNGKWASIPAIFPTQLPWQCLS